MRDAIQWKGRFRFCIKRFFVGTLVFRETLAASKEKGAPMAKFVFKVAENPWSDADYDTVVYTGRVLRPVFTILVKYQKYLATSPAWRDTLEEVDSRLRRSDFFQRVPRP